MLPDGRARSWTRARPIRWCAARRSGVCGRLSRVRGARARACVISCSWSSRMRDVRARGWRTGWAGPTVGCAGAWRASRMSVLLASRGRDRERSRGSSIWSRDEPPPGGGEGRTSPACQEGRSPRCCAVSGPLGHPRRCRPAAVRCVRAPTSHFARMSAVTRLIPAVTSAITATMMPAASPVACSFLPRVRLRSASTVPGPADGREGSRGHGACPRRVVGRASGSGS